MMKKKDIISLSASALILASLATLPVGTVNADENSSALDDSSAIHVEQPTQPAADDKPTPAEPDKDSSSDKPEIPVTPPSDDKEVVPSEPTQPADEEKKDDGKKDEEKPNPSEQPKPNLDDKGTIPISDEEKPAPTNKPNKPSEPIVPVTPSIDKPVVTDTGAEIVGTDNGKVIVKDNTSGNTQVIDAKQVGGKVDKDGTIVVKNKDGKNVRLPKAGETETFLTTLLLILLAFVGLREIKPFEKNNWLIDN